MRHKTFLYMILSCFLLLGIQGRARAESAAGWVKKGNQAYEAKKYDDAVKAYVKAGVDAPESALIDFNKGAAFYRKGDWEKAKDAWTLAAQKAKGPLLTARALYNLGNCEYKMAQRQKDSDMQKAVDACTQSIQNYQKAMDQLSSMEGEGEGERDGKSDPALKKDAAKNIEIVRLVMKSMLDEINRQKEAEKQARNAADALKKLIDRQKELINRNQYFAQEKDDTPKKDKEISGLATDQKRLAGDTDKTADAMSVKGGKKSGGAQVPKAASDALAAAKKLLKKAVGDQTSAAKKIGDRNLPDGGTDQAAALSKMEKALDALKKQANQGQSQSGKKQNQDQKQAQSQTGKKAEQKKGEKKDNQNAQAAKKQDAKKDGKTKNGQDTAEKIIDQERERQDRNANRSSGGYSDVDKNW